MMSPASFTGTPEAVTPGHEAATEDAPGAGALANTSWRSPTFAYPVGGAIDGSAPTAVSPVYEAFTVAANPFLFASP
jgi:hypothetical protein